MQLGNDEITDMIRGLEKEVEGSNALDVNQNIDYIIESKNDAGVLYM